MSSDIKVQDHFNSVKYEASLRKDIKKEQLRHLVYAAERCRDAVFSSGGVKRCMADKGFMENWRDMFAASITSAAVMQPDTIYEIAACGDPNAEESVRSCLSSADQDTNTDPKYTPFMLAAIDLDAKVELYIQAADDGSGFELNDNFDPIDDITLTSEQKANFKEEYESVRGQIEQLAVDNGYSFETVANAEKEIIKADNTELYEILIYEIDKQITEEAEISEAGYNGPVEETSSFNRDLAGYELEGLVNESTAAVNPQLGN